MHTHYWINFVILIFLYHQPASLVFSSFLTITSHVHLENLICLIHLSKPVRVGARKFSSSPRIKRQNHKIYTVCFTVQHIWHGISQVPLNSKNEKNSKIIHFFGCTRDLVTLKLISVSLNESFFFITPLHLKYITMLFFSTPKISLLFKIV